MNSERYIKTIEGTFLHNAQEMRGKDWVLQQDNASAHISKQSQKFFEDEGIKVLDWPANSPDLNPIENLWPVLKHRVYERNPASISDLRMHIEEEITNIDNNYVASFASTMSKRVLMAIENEGDVVDY